MQYSVPQFVDVEDKIIGPLGLKQFIILIFGGLVSLFYWSLFKLGAVFFLLSIPTMLVFLYFAFGKFNGRPIMTSLFGLTEFFLTPRVRVFRRTGERPLAIVQKVTAKDQPEHLTPEAATSRLKRLAYLLDQKAAEEERLVTSGQLKGKWLNQI